MLHPSRLLTSTAIIASLCACSHGLPLETYVGHDFSGIHDNTPFSSECTALHVELAGGQSRDIEQDSPLGLPGRHLYLSHGGDAGVVTVTCAKVVLIEGRRSSVETGRTTVNLGSNTDGGRILIGSSQNVDAVLLERYRRRRQPQTTGVFPIVAREFDVRP